MKTARQPFVLATTLLGLLAGPVLADVQPASGDFDEFKSCVLHAETYQALSLMELNSEVVEAGKSWAAKAKERLSGLPKAYEQNSEYVELRKRLEIVDKKLDGELELARESLESRFPLTRFLVSSFLLESGGNAVYELTGDPRLKAAKHAVRQIAAREDAIAKGALNVPVVFFIVPSWAATGAAAYQATERWENRLFGEFADYPQFSRHSAIELEVGTHTVPPELLLEDQKEGASPQIAKTVLTALGASKALAVVVREKDTVDDIHLVTANAHLLSRDKAPESVVTSGISRDRVNRFPWIVAAIAGLMATACLFYFLIVSTHCKIASERSWRARLVVPLVGFAVGLTASHAIAPAVGALSASHAAPAANLWFPCLAGLAVLGGPLVVYWLASQWLAKLWPFFSLNLRGGAVLAAVGAGVAAYLAQPLLLYVPQNLAAVDFCLMAVSVVVLGYLAGRSLDRLDPLPLPLSTPILLLAAPVGMAVLTASSAWMAAASVPLVAMAAAAVVWDRKRRGLRSGEFVPPSEGADAPECKIPSDVLELVLRAEHPAFQSFSSFEAARQMLAPLLEGKSCHLALFGVQGAGKTAALDSALATTIAAYQRRQQALPADDGKRPRLSAPIVLRGCCPAPGGEATPFAAFRQALARHFEVNFLAPPGPKLDQIGQTLGVVVGSFIPFSQILFPRSPANAGTAAEPEEIHASIAWLLRRLAGDGPVVLVLDDVQWIDDASEALVKHLVEQFPPGENGPLAIVLAGSDGQRLRKLGIDARCLVEIVYPSRDEQTRILVRGLGLRSDVAEAILDRIGTTRGTSGGLFWPLCVVAELARAGALVRTDEGFIWANDAWPANIPVPDRIEVVIERQLADAAQHRMILECAACAASGLEFNVSIIAAVLKKPCLEVLSALDGVARTTHLVRDVPERDDIYEFRSTFVVQQIRKMLGFRDIAAAGGETGTVPIFAEPPWHPLGGRGEAKMGPGTLWVPSPPDVAAVQLPQIVREYHGQIAEALEQTPAGAANKLFEIANHYYLAGARYADKAVELCLRAVHAAVARSDFASADRYLQMAGHCAQWTEKLAVVATESQLVRCLAARFAGQSEERASAVAEVLRYVGEHGDAPERLVLAAADLCYVEAHRSRKLELLETAARLCRQVAANSTAVHEQARALHIMALAAPNASPTDQIRSLTEAREVIEKSGSNDSQALGCLAQIVNSLAKALSKKALNEKTPGQSADGAELRQAQQLFETRLKWEIERQLHDPHGYSMALGGLGRLAWFASKPDVASAERYFRDALTIAEQINDRVAQVKLHSFLGACALHACDVAGALAHYETSAKLRGDRIDQWFSSIGLMRCYDKLDRTDAFAAEAQKLTGMLGTDGVPPDCASLLRQTLNACTGPRLDAVAELLGALRRTGGAGAS